MYKRCARGDMYQCLRKAPSLTASIRPQGVRAALMGSEHSRRVASA
jgi:hypothetical protein